MQLYNGFFFYFNKKKKVYGKFDLLQIILIVILKN